MNAAIATVVAAVMGAVVGVLGTFWFQKKLFKQQLDFQERSQKQLHEFIQSLHSTFLGTIEKVDQRLSRIADRLPGGRSFADFYQADQKRRDKQESERQTQ